MTEKQINILNECSGVLKLIAGVVWRDIPKCHQETLYDVVDRIQEVLQEDETEHVSQPLSPAE